MALEYLLQHPLTWIAIATLVNEDLGCVGAGLSIARGDVSLFAGAAVCLGATLAGDLTWFLLGRHVGRPVLRYPPLVWLFDDRQYALAEAWVADRGMGIGLFTRFLPGIRAPLLFFLGLLGMEPRLAVTYLVTAALIYVPLLLGLSMAFGTAVQTYFPIYGYGALAFFLALITLLGVSHLIRKRVAWREEEVARRESHRT